MEEIQNLEKFDIIEPGNSVQSSENKNEEKKQEKKNQKDVIFLQLIQYY